MYPVQTQKVVAKQGPLLDRQGNLTQVGWSRQPMLDSNLENAVFYPKLLRPLQRFRVKRWDYYAVFTPERFFSATIADLGYAGNVFVYTIDFNSGRVDEDSLVIPLGKGIQLPRNSTEGEAHYTGKQEKIVFHTENQLRHVSVSWPAFRGDIGIWAEIDLIAPPGYESMNIVLPIEEKRFYYNRKINCLPADGWVRFGTEELLLKPTNSIGSLDWGRGVWAYSSFWVWASSSGFLPDGRTVGLNLGGGFGDTNAATENCLILNNRIHKFGHVKIDYNQDDFMQPWVFTDEEDRLKLTFYPYLDRTARTDLMIVTSEVHQMFGHYEGEVLADDGEKIIIKELTGFAEEHHARW